MTPVKAFVLLIMLLVTPAGSIIAETGVLRDDSYAYDSNVRRLCGVKLVMFGSSMTPGLSAGELLLRRLLREKDPLPFLVAAYNHGTPEAKAYALAGIHFVSPELFQVCRKDIVGRYNPPIRIQAGCLQMNTTLLEEVIRIDRGDYDHYLGSNEWPR